MDAEALVREVGFRDLKLFIIERSGLVYFRDKDVDLAQRIYRRLEASGAVNPRAYLDLLRHPTEGPPEFERLAVELTIGETYFFRHQEQFDVLKDTIIPDLIARNQATRRLRIWCAGCSIGAEPYSVAISLADDFKTALSGWDVKVIGTDINREFLSRAVHGVFDDWAFRLTAPDLRARHFTRIEKSWRINDDVRRLVEFHPHNLMQTPYPTLLAGGATFDLIVCRNVMIYFDWTTIARLMPHFEDALGDGAWMIIGHAEQAHGATKLRLVQTPNVIVYQKGAAPPNRAPSAVVRPTPATTPPPRPGPVAVPNRAVNLDPEILFLKRLADGGEFDQAIALCAKLTALDPSDPRPHFYRGLICGQIKRAGEIIQCFERAIALDQSFVMAHYHLALHHQRGRDPQAASRRFRNLVSLLAALPETLILPEADQMTLSSATVI